MRSPRALGLVASTLLVVICVSASVAASSSAASHLFSSGSNEHIKISFLSDLSSDDAASAEFYSSPDKIVPMALPNGSRYHCRLPGRAASQEDDDRMWRRHLQRVRDHPLPEHQLARINAALRDQCFTQPAGWWTYKLCWGQGLRQFHADAAGKIETEYILGQGPLKEIDDGAEDELLFDIDAFDPTKARLLAEWFNGTECDLTKEQRQMQLLMYCSDGPKPSGASGNNNNNNKNVNPQDPTSSGNMELSITEPLSCQYSVTLKHPVFCGIPELKARRAPELIVECAEVPPSPSNEEETL